MAAISCMYSARPSPAPTCGRKTVTEEQVEELAYQEEGRCNSRLLRRKSRREGGEEGEEVVWEGVVRREIEAGTEEVWEMVSRFGKMKSWLPHAEVCEVVEGEEDEPGCVRFVAGREKTADGAPQRWVKEKLLEVRPTQRCFTYCMLDSSYGYQGYKATLAISPVHLATPARAVVHWTFQLHPVLHTSPPQLLSFLTSIFDNMMHCLERAIVAISVTAHTQ